jgi:ACR3 family arsenite efflux pump ArsB
MGILSKLQPAVIVFSAVLGIFLGNISVHIERNAGRFMELFLMTMLFFTFLGVDIKKIRQSFSNLKFSISAAVINFLWTPVFTFVLARLFLSEQTSLQIGFIMLMVTPCTDWYLIFTGLADGNVTLGSSILPLNLILQIVLMPVYLFVFMGRTVSFDSKIIIQSIALALFMPLISANAIKFIIHSFFQKLETGFNRLLEKNDDIQFMLLCFAIVSMFASQGTVLTTNLIIFIKILPPLIIFFTVNFFLSLFAGSKLKLPFRDIVPLIFTTSARNSPVALAIAVISFPTEPVISLTLAMGPLIELPILAVYSTILKKLSYRRFSG